MKKERDNWILSVFILTFILSVVFSGISNICVSTFNEVILFIILLIVISLGILFDSIGTASITANEATFHSMSSNKIKGAKEAITLIKNASKIASICNDVIGDICGILSGALGAVLAISISTTTGVDNVIVSILVSALISSLTVGGKAIFKRIAMAKSDSIIFAVGKIKHIFRLK